MACIVDRLLTDSASVTDIFVVYIGRLWRP